MPRLRRSALPYHGADRSETMALIDFYNATGGPSWTNNTNWLTAADVSTWYGVTTSGGHITEINLNTNNLVGTIPAGDWLGYLPYLTNFRVYNNAGLSGDLSDWTLPASLVDLFMYTTGVSGDISSWVLPASLVNCSVHTTNVSGDISGWVLPATLQAIYIHFTGISGDISSWVLPLLMRYLWCRDNNTVGTPDISINTAMREYRGENRSLTQANVDAIIASVYARRMAFTYATPSLNVGGTNATPTGVYQSVCPATTALEQVHNLANDGCGEGHNTWTVTWNGGSAP